MTPTSRHIVTNPSPAPGHLRPHDLDNVSLLESVSPEDRAEVSTIEAALLDRGLSNKLSHREGLLRAAAFKDDPDLREHFNVVRGGITLFGFDLRPLAEDEIDECAELATTYIENKKWGPVPIPEKTDKAEYRRRLIAKATPEPDHAACWMDRSLWESLGVATAHDAVRVLLPGEIEECIGLINKISGYALDQRESHKGRDVAKP